jgi:hypothetical protein
LSAMLAKVGACTSRESTVISTGLVKGKPLPE